MRQSLPFIRCRMDAMRVAGMQTHGQPLGLYLANNFYLTKQAEEEVRNVQTQEAVANALLRHYGPRLRS